MSAKYLTTPWQMASAMASWRQRPSSAMTGRQAREWDETPLADGIQRKNAARVRTCAEVRTVDGAQPRGASEWQLGFRGEHEIRGRRALIEAAQRATLGNRADSEPESDLSALEPTERRENGEELRERTSGSTGKSGRAF